jgi:hypothetical protein
MTASSGDAHTTDAIRAAIDATPVARLLSDRPAVVLERIARGGGATRWYHLERAGDLSVLFDLLTPGSAVSFYFDGRLDWRRMDDEVVDVILDLVHANGEAVVGVLSADQVTIDVEFVAGLGDLTEFLGSFGNGAWLLVGNFPARDNDGENAITVELPDADGVLRRHPH